MYKDFEAKVRDNDDMPSFPISRPTSTTVPNFEKDDPNNVELDELPDFIEQNFDEDEHLLLTQEISNTWIPCTLQSQPKNFSPPK